MKNKVYEISLISLLFVCAMNVSAYARVNVKTHQINPGSRSQIASQRQQMMNADANTVTTTTSAIETLPVAVDNPEIKQSILDNTSDTVNADDLERCSMIYPNGLFKWGIPEAGIRKNPISQCVAIVELRNANTNAILAQTTLAAGDMMKCNIDMFPQSGWQPALENTELPADEEPTIEDVEQVMNQEQKQNAGLKIAAAAIISGVAGNMLSPKTAGDTKLLGTSDSQLIGTAISAAAGAGIMAAGTYSGKVAGDTIKSTAVNAATGAVVGNMAGGMSGGESTLSIQKCSVKGTNQDGKTTEIANNLYCVAGNIETIDTGKEIKDYKYGDNIYLINKNNKVKKCTLEKCSSSDKCEKLQYDDKDYVCKDENVRLLNIFLSKDYAWNKRKDKDSMGNLTLYHQNEDTKQFTKQEAYNLSDAFNKDYYFLIYNASFSAGTKRHGYAVFSSALPNKLFGYKTTEWEDLVAQYKPEYYARNYDGSLGDKEDVKNKNIIFTPLEVDSDDGALVDFSNKGRMKATLSGAAAGGALGGFAGYQGAKQEVQERWVAATREYNDSLTNFYCATGTRFLSSYNSYIEIPLPLEKSE